MGRTLIPMEWQRFAGAATGRSHEEKGLPCQDAVYTLATDEVSLIALSDGAGSAKHAAEGAKLAVELLATYIAGNFEALFTNSPDEAADKLIDRFLEELKDVYPEEDVAAFACTFLFVATDREGRCVSGHLGDGVIGAREENGWYLFSAPENGEFYNSTYFLTSKQAKNCFRIKQEQHPNRTGFVLMSDGSAESLFNRSERKFAPALETIFNWTMEHEADVVQQALEQNLKEVIRDKTGDDCSISLMTAKQVIVKGG